MGQSTATMTKRLLESLLDRTSGRYDQCWNTLCRLKNRNDKPDLGKGLREFQPTLCEALLDLEKAYQAIVQQKDALVTRKAYLSAGWFARRMKTLARYQEALERCMSIGRSLGDSFAWIFYEDEPALLAEHLQHEGTRHMPTGIGGIGELEFIRNVKRLGERLIIYHGITTFLRLGDVSLYDTSTRKIVALGELKTRSTDDSHVEITIILTARRLQDAIPDAEAPEAAAASGNGVTAAPLLADLPRRRKDQLGRQLKAMALSFQRREGWRDYQESFRGDFHIDELKQLCARLKTAAFVYQQIGPGLLLVAYKGRNRPMSSRLLGQSLGNLDRKLRDASEHIRSILDPTSSDNVLYNGSFYYDQEGRTNHVAGTVPLFWWPLGTDFVRAIIFQDVFIITIFNPLHLVRKLESLGLKAELNANVGTYTVSKETKDGILKVEQFGHFMKLVQDYLFKEDSIVGLLDSVIKSSMEGLPVGSRTSLLIQQSFIASPTHL